MSLLVISELFLPTKGGTAVWFDEVYRRLGGKEIHILTADVPGAAEHDRFQPNSVHRLRLERHRWLRPESALMYARLLLHGLWLAVRHRLKAVHAGRVLPEGLVGWCIARALGLSLTLYAHGEEITAWGKGGKFKVAAWTFRRADVVIANSAFTREALLGLGVAAERIRLIYPGVDTGRFRPGLVCQDLKTRVGLKPGQALILSVGRLSRRKGFDRVIEALPALHQAGIDAHYAIIGVGSDEAHLQALARRSGFANRVHLVGHVPPSDLPRWYNACQVFAMPNRAIDGDTEGFGLVFLEAAACGRPALAGREGGTGDAVADGLTGLRVDGNDPDAVAAALIRILGDRHYAERLGAAALERVQREFDWARVAERTAPLARLRRPFELDRGRPASTDGKRPAP